MSLYYFVATALPPLQIGVRPEITLEELTHLLKDNLSESDYDQVIVMRLFYDIQNIRALWRKEELDPFGNFNKVDLEDALVTREGLPQYVYDFVDAHDSVESRLHYFPGLTATYFREEIKNASGFLKKYLTFEREWRLVLLGFRAKQLGREITKELQFEDPQDEIVAQILAQKDAKSYIPPDGYEELLPLFEEYGNSPVELYQALCAYRFRKIEEMVEIDLFSLDRILGYLAQFFTVEKWFLLDQHKGRALMTKITAGVAV